ncbi:MAG: vWA domain-containing protein [Afipia sp.]
MTDTYEQQPFDPGPFIDNPSQRCPCLLLLDVSGSMSGRPIEELNAGVTLLKDELSADPLASKRVQIAVVTFGPVETVTEFVDAGLWTAPHLTSKGDTPMGEAIERGLQMLESQKAIYRSNGIPPYRPWVFLITDGGPTDSWQNAARMVREGEVGKKFKFFAVGVEGANFDVLKQISVGDPIKLKGLRFRDLFAWLSSSLASVSRSQPEEEVTLVNPVTPNGWGSIA